ncbi:PAB-dependent poly(A)-specific ribonuclease subunit 3 [Paramarasmius palmivorus]|uniref:PAN2-PAN3 deadenylation complex subunit PAN3 n=1 Tax=Paramarasmius palmivorus TaxID=297713 RepID=A0AAW0CJ96_9AGAR
MLVMTYSEDARTSSNHVCRRSSWSFQANLSARTRSDSPVTSISAQAVNAPVFVPKASFSSSTIASRASPPSSPPEYQAEPASYEQYGYAGDTSIDSLTEQVSEASAVCMLWQAEFSLINQMDTRFYDSSSQGSLSNYAPEYSQNGMDMSYYSGSGQYLIREPVSSHSCAASTWDSRIQQLNYHLYTPNVPAPFISSATDSYFVPPSSELRQLLQTRSETTRSVPPIGLGLPEEIQGYHSLTPLDTTGLSDRRKLGNNWYSIVYRAIHQSDGIPYVLRRVENFRLMHQSAFSSIETWSKIRHPSIVSVHEAFTTRSFNDNSLVVAYSYHPGAQTLFDAHLKPKTAIQNGYSGRSQSQQLTPLTSIPERTLWSYIIQIASAIKKVHEAGLAVRMIDPTKILLTGKNRVRISSCGLLDVMMYDTHQDVHVLQQDDLSQFGRLVFALTCCNPTAAAANSFQKSLDTMARLYSPDIKNAALFLISKSSPHKNINRLYEIIGSRIVTELDDALGATDRLENELMGELENARLVRLLCKFGFINERPEFALDPRWSETGDRYIIKLFRDYVFHQIDEHGNPVTNLSHVLTCLNKLDAGSDEKIMLVARDEQSCLVVSYREIRNCLEAAFGDLARSGSSTR